MIDTTTLVNTCYATTETSRNIAFYSHLIPVFFALSLAFLVFFKAKRTILSKIFLSFSIVFSLWLLGDLVTWTSNNYYLIYASWSTLVFLEVVFFVLGLYFATVFVRKSDISPFNKLLFFSATLVPLFFTITRQSVTGFNYPVCEAFNSGFLDQYKLYLEILILGIVFLLMLIPFFRKSIGGGKKSHLIILGSMFLFLSVFGITEYLASVTGFYELNLYALFVIPIFLVAITYSIFSLDIFNLKVISTYFLVFGFLALIASQLLFVTSSTNILLTILTLILSIFFSFMLFKNLHKESEQRIHIEKLNVELGDLIKQRESLMHLINHKVKGAFTRSKYIFAGMLDGTFGDINEEVKKRAGQGLESDDVGIKTIDLVLNAANMQKGVVKYEMKNFDFKEVVQKVVADKKVPAEAKGLKMQTEIKDGIYNILGDAFWLKEVVNNLIDNSVRYTKTGNIIVGLERIENKIRFWVKDTGMGITDEDKKNLFTEGGRGKDSVKINVDSTGYGLYTVKLVIEAHKGRVWAESEGEGKGSTFFVELDAV